MRYKCIPVLQVYRKQNRKLTWLYEEITYGMLLGKPLESFDNTYLPCKTFCYL